MRRTQQLGHFAPYHAFIGQAICQSATKETYSNLKIRWVEGLLTTEVKDRAFITDCFLMTHHGS